MGLSENHHFPAGGNTISEADGLNLGADLR